MSGTDLRETLPVQHRPESRMWFGRFAADVASFGDLAHVTLPDMDPNQSWGPCRWQRNGKILPQKDDECLVAIDNLNRPWIVGWWSLDPQPPINPVDLSPGANGQVLETTGGLAGWHDLVVGIGNLSFDPATQAELDAEAALRAAHAALTVTAHGGIVASTDARLTDARTPTAHHLTHAAAGSDPVTITEAQVTNLVADLAAILATPVLRAESGGSVLGGQAAGSYLFGMDGGAVTPTTLQNAVLSLFRYNASLDAPPSGFKTQWQLVVEYQTNNTSPARTVTWALWEQSAVAGGAGGFTTTGVAALTNPTQVAVALTANNNAEVATGWHDHGVVGDIEAGKMYGFALFIATGALAASSAVRWRMGLWRRYVPV